MSETTRPISEESALIRILKEVERRRWEVPDLAFLFMDLHDRGERVTTAKIINRMPPSELIAMKRYEGGVSRREWRDGVNTALEGFHIEASA